jgi:hypothetical protein
MGSQDGWVWLVWLLLLLAALMRFSLPPLL